MSERSDIEDAVVKVLSELTIASGSGVGYLERLEAYQGDTSPDADDRDVRENLLGQSPAVLITTGASDFSDYTLLDENADERLDVVLLIVSTNNRSREANARGDATGDPGIYKILQDVRKKLMGSDLGGCVKYIRPRRTTPVAIVNGTAIWSMTCDVVQRVTGTPLDERDGSFATISQEVNNADDSAADPVITADNTLTT